MKKIDICYGAYAAKYGLTDFYDDSKWKLLEALESGEDFETSYGCKKEIRYATIRREGSEIVLTVTACMDDLYESDALIYDALFDRLGAEEELPDDVIDSIRDAAYDVWLTDEVTEIKRVMATLSFEEICQEIEALEEKAEEGNREMFDRLCDIVENIVGG